MPVGGTAVYDGYFNVSPECWQLFTEVLGSEFGNAVLFGQVHQLTVDAYAVQHAGGGHPNKSVDVHLTGLHLVLERGIKPPNVARYLQRLAGSVDAWPHFAPPTDRCELTVFDVACADSMLDHASASRRWAESVWQAWGAHHGAVRAFAQRHLGFD